jgi:hypothetical protein
VPSNGSLINIANIIMRGCPMKNQSEHYRNENKQTLKEFYVDKIKMYEKRKRILKTDFFDSRIEECKQMLSKIEEQGD